MEPFLLVDDDPATKKFLPRLLARRFPDAEIEVAGTKDEAMEKLVRYDDEGTALVAAILDLKIPERMGENPEVSALCKTVEKLQPQALIVHITGHFLDDPKVVRHLAEYHSGYDKNPSAAPVWKKDRWEDDLCSRIATFLVTRQLRAIEGNRVAMGRGLRTVGPSLRGASHRRERLLNDVERYWKFLDEELQEEIRTSFDVHEERGSVTVR